MNKEVKKIGILGAGVMGRGLSYMLAKIGVQVLVWNRKTPERILGEIGEILSDKVERGDITEIRKKIILSNIIPINDFSMLREAEAVIETVVEDFQVKRKIISDLCKFGDFKFIATNTSCFSIIDLSKDCLLPDKIVGLHFFNPPTKMDLVEIIITDDTSDITISACKEFCKMINKFPVIISDNVGSIVNRILCAAINEAVRIYKQAGGKLTFDEIDTAMVKGASWPMGPFALTDLIGIDVCHRMLESLSGRFTKEVFLPEDLLQDFVSTGQLGRKTDKGFYRYSQEEF